ncbi:MAG: hypothetical protein PHV20_05715 [Bacteroidales bacterium]|nr:hypothetical protein [Bacteroidales bacterium]
MSHRFIKLFVLLTLIMLSVNTNSQNRKIAIISLEDTTIVRCHVGLTIFSNFTDTLDIKAPIGSFIENSLTKYLSPKYDVEIVKAPSNIRNNATTFFGRSKEYKGWIKEIESKYDMIILVENIDIPLEMNIKIPYKTSGFYTRMSRKYIYTTITFNAYKTNPKKELEYYNMGGEFLTEIKDFDLPEDKRTFSESGLAYIKEALLVHIDNRIIHFLHKSFLCPSAGM